MQPVSLEDCKRTSYGTLACASGKQYFVRNVYPPIQELQPQVLFVVVIFVLCFIMGICGNSSVLTIIRGIVSERKSGASGGGAQRRNADNTILYIAALCLVDFLMSLSLPPAILDSIIGFWMFGTAICKLHHVCGSVGRIVSTFLITAMSFDRFVAVCHPYETKLRSRRFVISIIMTLWTAAFVLLSPMLIYAKANEILLHQAIQPAGVNVHPHDAFNLTRMRVYKCADMMPPYVFYWFTTSTFLTGYLMPLCLIVYFNSRLIRKLYRHTKVIPRSGIPLRRISIYTILIAVLYFVCWTPYWCSVLYATYRSATETDGPSESSESELLVYIIYCVHALPYFGSATNWILYGLLNTQLQIRHDSSGGGGGGTASSATRGSIGPSVVSSTFYGNSTGKVIAGTFANNNGAPVLSVCANSANATTPDSVEDMHPQHKTDDRADATRHNSDTSTAYRHNSTPSLQLNRNPQQSLQTSTHLNTTQSNSIKQEKNERTSPTNFSIKKSIQIEFTRQRSRSGSLIASFTDLSSASHEKNGGIAEKRENLKILKERQTSPPSSRRAAEADFFHENDHDEATLLLSSTSAYHSCAKAGAPPFTASVIEHCEGDQKL